MGSAAPAASASPQIPHQSHALQDESFEAAELAFRRVDPEVSRLPERSWTLAPPRELWIYQRMKAYDADGWARRFGRSTGGGAGISRTRSFGWDAVAAIGCKKWCKNMRMSPKWSKAIAQQAAFAAPVGSLMQFICLEFRDECRALGWGRDSSTPQVRRARSRLALRPRTMMMVQLSSLPSVELIAAASTSRLSDECHSPSEACARVSCVFIVSGEFQPAVSLLRQLSREVFSINLAVVSTSMQCVRRSLITFLLNAFTKLEMPKTSTKHEITCSGIVPPAKTALFFERSAITSNHRTGVVSPDFAPLWQSAAS